MEQVKGKNQVGVASRTRSLAFIGLSIALMAVSAWVSIPLGPVPFTLQTFVMVFVLLALKPGECLASIAGYLVLGAIGLPVFSSMRGGIGVLAGPTGGFLWGFVLGAAVALAFLLVVRKAMGSNEQARTGVRGIVVDAIAAILFLVVAYACGCVQLMAVASLSFEAAFATAVAPFVIVDALKIAAALAVAKAVRQAIR